MVAEEAGTRVQEELVQRWTLQIQICSLYLQCCLEVILEIGIHRTIFSELRWHRVKLLQMSGAADPIGNSIIWRLVKILDTMSGCRKIIMHSTVQISVVAWCTWLLW